MINIRNTAADNGKNGAHYFQQQSHQTTRLFTAAAALLCITGLFVLVTAENYGTKLTTTTTEQIDAQDCAATDAPKNSHKKSSLRQEKKFHSKTVKREKDGEEEEHDFLPDAGQCTLYLAPSSLPHAGLGLFSGTAYDEKEHPSLWTDLFVPIDDQYKALPYRGQQRFPSWLQYIWQKSPGALSDLTTNSPYPGVPSELWDFDDGLNSADGVTYNIVDLVNLLFEFIPEYQPPNKEDLIDLLYGIMPQFQSEQRVSAFVPGLSSLANSHDSLANIDRIYAKSWHGVEFIATKGVREGMELLLDYGKQWNLNNSHKLEGIAKKKKKEDAKEKREGVTSETHHREGFVEGINKKWDILDKQWIGDIPEELPTEKAKRDRLALGRTVDSSASSTKPYSEYRKNDFHPWKAGEEEHDNDGDDEDHPTTLDDITKPLTWLNQNGICLSYGKLRVGNSAIQYAGRGVFATKLIRKGEVVFPSPLIAMREEDFTIYKSDHNQVLVRNIIDKSTVVGKEFLFNYAFTHPESPLYLVPTAPLANFINHGNERMPRSRAGANVQIRWPKAGSNTAKLFEWAYNQKHGNHFDNDFEKHQFGSNHNAWLKDHPIDVMERSGKLALEYVALSDINIGDEILLDYGNLWDEAWVEFQDRHPHVRSVYFRHAIGVPADFYPDNWLNVSDLYEIAEIKDLENKPLKPGVAVPLTWAHNGKPVGSKYAYAVGLEKGSSNRFLEYSEKKGVVELYRRLLTEQEGYHLPSDGFGVYKSETLANNTFDADKPMEFFAHRYHSTEWSFNMHYVAAWDELARKDVLKALGDAGFDIAIKGIGERFGYDNITCFHGSYMGLSHCDKSKMHSDIYATDNKSWNIVFPLITVEGSDPELDIMSENMNTMIGVHYLKDVAYALGDFGYHQTRPTDYYNPDGNSVDYDDMALNDIPIRVVFGAYCAQIDENNVAMIRHIYDGEDPAPFADQFIDVPMREIHWDRATGTSTLAKPGGKRR